MGKTKIDWGFDNLHNWNLTTGCKNGCKYCYAKAMNDRFNFVEKWNSPQIHPERLSQPLKRKKPTIYFVSTMGDIMGNWIPYTFIKDAIEIIKQCPQHTFMFLTKNPNRYVDFNFPGNCWLGVTIEHRNKYHERVSYFRQLCSPNLFFVSIEPILSDFTGLSFSMFDKVIIGQMTGKNAVKAKQEWIDSIDSNDIYLKNNLKTWKHKTNN